MNNRDYLLLALFVTSIVSLGVLLEVSITGKVSQTMYCDNNGECYELCSNVNKCSLGLECCDVQGLGVCGESCEEVYEQILPATLGVDVDARGAEVQQPSAISFVTTVVYLSLIFIAILVAGIYFAGRKHGKN